MTIRARIDPIAQDIRALIDEMSSPRQQSRAAADFAREQLREAQDVNRRALGRVPPHTIAVDGRQGAPLDSVKVPGTILVEFELVNDVLVWIGQALIERSPRVSGEYIRGHKVFADGREIPLGQQAPPAREYSFANAVPYARKIEIGKTQSGHAFVIQVENRIYERTARDARGRFGNIAKIDFTYRALTGSEPGPTIVVTPN